MPYIRSGSHRPGSAARANCSQQGWPLTPRHETARFDRLCTARRSARPTDTDDTGRDDRRIDS